MANQTTAEHAPRSQGAMYRSNLNATDKSGAVAAVVAVHVALFFVLMQLSGRIDVTDPQRTLRLFNVSEVPPPPPEVAIPPPPPQRQQREKPKASEGAASPENIRSKATPVVAPKPRIALPLPVPMATTETPNTGADPTQGASDQVGGASCVRRTGVRPAGRSEA